MQKAIDILMNILFFILKITALVSDSGKRFAKKLLSSTVRLLLVLGIKVPLFAIGVLPYLNQSWFLRGRIFLVPRFTTQLTFRWSGCVGNISLVMFTIFLNISYQFLLFFFRQRFNFFDFPWHPTKLRINVFNCYRNIFT